MEVVLAANLAALLFSFFVAGVLVGTIYSQYAGDALVEFFLDGKQSLILGYTTKVASAKRGIKKLRRKP